MLMTDEAVNSRISHPDNLVNRMRLLTYNDRIANLPPRNSEPIDIPMMPPSVDSLMDGVDTKLRLGLAGTQSLDVLIDAVNALKVRLPEVENPKDLARIASDMGKIVTGIQNTAQSNGGGNRSQVIIWKPIVVNESHYEAMTVPE